MAQHRIADLELELDAPLGRAEVPSPEGAAGPAPGPVAAAISGSANCATILSACRPGPGTCQWRIAGPGGGARSTGSVACSAVTGGGRPAGGAPLPPASRA